MARTTPVRSTERDLRRAPAALAAGAALLLPLAACSTSGEDVAAERSPVASASSSTAVPTTPAEGSPDGPTGTPEPGTGPALEEEGAGGPALDHLEALAAGDADSAWEDLAPAAQQTWPDRATFDEQVAQQARDYAAVLDADPVTTTVEVTDLSVTTLAGVVDPAGSPRVSVYTVVTGRNGVYASAPGVLPSLEWLNPTLEGAGSLGVAEYEATRPVSVRLGPGATSFGFVIDGQRLEARPRIEQDPDQGSVVSVETSALSPGQHVVTALFGYPGEVPGASALVIEVR